MGKISYSPIVSSIKGHSYSLTFPKQQQHRVPTVHLRRHRSKSGSAQANAVIFKDLIGYWNVLPKALKDSWKVATPRPLTGINWFIKTNWQASKNGTPIRVLSPAFDNLPPFTEFGTGRLGGPPCHLQSRSSFNVGDTYLQIYKTSDNQKGPGSFTITAGVTTYSIFTRFCWPTATWYVVKSDVTKTQILTKEFNNSTFF